MLYHIRSILLNSAQSETNNKIDINRHQIYCSRQYQKHNWMKAEKNLSNLFLIFKAEAWEHTFKPILVELAKKQLKSQAVVRKIQQLKYHSYLCRSSMSRVTYKMPSMKLLNKLYPQELPEIFGNIAQYFLSYQAKNVEIPLFLGQQELSHTFQKTEVVFLVCMMSLMLCTSQKQKQNGGFHTLDDFSFVFSSQEFKTKGVIQYLKLQLASLTHPQQNINQEKLTIRRKVFKGRLEQILDKDLAMLQPLVAGNNESIQHYYGSTKVDFANRYIGGGSLHTGCVQEEIMFANRPELCTSIMLCEVMDHNEAIEFIGYKKYFKNKGYAWTCEYDGKEALEYEFDSEKRAKQYIVAIDAIAYFSQNQSIQQFGKELIDREILKAYTGFAGSQSNEIVTGNWGCGAFNGNISLKFMIQWIASSLCGKKMIYVPFGSAEVVKKEQLFQCLKNEKVKNVYDLLVKLSEKTRNSKTNIMDVLKMQLRKK